MFTKRIIPCLDVNRGRVVKGVNFVNLKDAGDPVEIAAAYDLDTRTCVRELMLMNNLKNDTIHAGNYLTVFYYDDDYK